MSDRETPCVIAIAETCFWSIVCAFVPNSASPQFQKPRDLRGCILALAWLLAAAVSLPASAQFDPPQSYYNPAIATTGAALKSALHEVIKGHTVLPYTATSTDTWDALKVLDEDPANASTVVLIYSGLTNAKAAQYTGTSGTWDREHLWPQSFGLVALSASSRAKTDIFNLRPIDNIVNSTRGNKFYDLSTAPVGTPRRRALL